jgi:hypothetical protein
MGYPSAISGTRCLMPSSPSSLHKTGRKPNRTCEEARKDCKDTETTGHRAWRATVLSTYSLFPIYISPIVRRPTVARYEALYGIVKDGTQNV